MLGAKKYNEKRGNKNVTVVYGCVTTGDDWIFMRLDHEIKIDDRKYYLGNLSELLGVFQTMIDYFIYNNQQEQLEIEQNNNA